MHYLNPVADKALLGHVIRTLTVNNGDQCEIRCYGELECLSYNPGPYQVDGHVCELSKSDHIRHPDDLVPMPVYIYRGTEVPFKPHSDPYSRLTDLKDVCRELHYLHPVVDKALLGHVIKTLTVNNGDQCEIRCYGELECLSYNLGPYQVDGHACELSKSDHIRHPDDLVPMPGFIYRGTEFREILFVDETSGDKAFFTYKLSSTLVAAGNYKTRLPERWTAGGIADTSYEYQLLICDHHFYSGFFISGYTNNCKKHCHNWCGDLSSPYFRSASTNTGSYGGVAFNVNGHRPLSSRLISVGLR
ncbi:hypothetical protein ACROYT_G019811 [Oculina patagonica]